MATLSRAERNALRSAQGMSTRGAVANATVSATTKSGSTVSSQAGSVSGGGSHSYSPPSSPSSYSPSATPQAGSIGDAWSGEVTSQSVTAPKIAGATKTIEPVETQYQDKPRMAQISPPVIKPELELLPEKLEEDFTKLEQGQNMQLREYAEQLGYDVGYDPATGQVTLNGISIPLDGMVLQDDHYMGSEKQIRNVTNLAKLGVQRGKGLPPTTAGVREYFHAQGRNVQYNRRTGEVLIDGTPIDLSKMGLLDGRYYADKNDLDSFSQMLDANNQVDKREDLEKTKQEEIISQYENLLKDNMFAKDVMMDEYLSQMQMMVQQMNDFRVQSMEALKNYQPVFREEALNVLREAYGNPFKYDPSQDPSLNTAMKYAENQVMLTMGSRGILHSSMTRDQLIQATSNLIPQYEQIAFNRYMENKQSALQYSDRLMEFDTKDYNKLKDYVTTSLGTMKDITTDNINLAKETLTLYNQKLTNRETVALQMVQNEQAKLDSAYKKWSAIGFADNEVARMLGIPVNTPTSQIQQQFIANENKLTMQQIEIEAELERMATSFAFDMAELEQKNSYAIDSEMRLANNYAVAGMLESKLAVLSPKEKMQVFHEVAPTYYQNFPEASEQINQVYASIWDEYVKAETLNQSQQRINLSRDQFNFSKTNSRSSGGSGGSGDGGGENGESLLTKTDINYIIKNIEQYAGADWDSTFDKKAYTVTVIKNLVRKQGGSSADFNEILFKLNLNHNNIIEQSAKSEGGYTKRQNELTEGMDMVNFMEAQNPFLDFSPSNVNTPKKPTTNNTETPKRGAGIEIPNLSGTIFDN